MSEIADKCPVHVRDAPFDKGQTAAWAYVRSGGEVFESDGAWYVTSPEAVRFVTRNHQFFSKAATATDVTSAPGGLIPIPGGVDPPEHARYRRLIDPMFSPRVIDSMDGALRGAMATIVEKFQDQGECEIMRDVADVFPTEAFSVMFGIPPEDREQCMKWVRAIMSAGHDFASAESAHAGGQQLAEYLASFIASKRQKPGDDVITKILEQDLSTDEIMGVSFNLFIAGLDTVTSAIGMMMNYLATHADLRGQLISDGSLIDPFIEEILRLESGTPFVVRMATQDAQVCGKTIPAGSTVFVGYAAADRDPGSFSSPDTVDLIGERSAHFGFGAGIHRCLGLHLARRELRIVFDEFHRRIPVYSLKAGHRPSFAWPAIIPSFDAVPLVFPAGGLT